MAKFIVSTTIDVDIVVDDAHDEEHAISAAEGLVDAICLEHPSFKMSLMSTSDVLEIGGGNLGAAKALANENAIAEDRFTKYER